MPRITYAANPGRALRRAQQKGQSTGIQSFKRSQGKTFSRSKKQKIVTVPLSVQSRQDCQQPLRWFPISVQCGGRNNGRRHPPKRLFAKNYSGSHINVSPVIQRQARSLQTWHKETEM
jgi:hypothetical protein